MSSLGYSTRIEAKISLGDIGEGVSMSLYFRHFSGKLTSNSHGVSSLVS